MNIHKIYITDGDRRGKLPADAAQLLLKELRNMDPKVMVAQLVLPVVWSWGENRNWMRLNMYELCSLMFVAAGDEFLFGCECSSDMELSIVARRY